MRRINFDARRGVGRAVMPAAALKKTPETKTVEQASHDETHGDDHHDDSDQGDLPRARQKTHDQQHAFMKHTVMPGDEGHVSGVQA
ncbi:MAG: hypothetical protein R3E66_13480 [bacterium]